MDWPPCLDASTPLLRFGSGSIPPDSTASIAVHAATFWRSCSGSILSSVSSGVWWIVEIARAVLAERDPRRAGLDRRLDIGAVGFALVVLDDAERGERGGQLARESPDRSSISCELKRHTRSAPKSLSPAMA